MTRLRKQTSWIWQSPTWSSSPQLPTEGSRLQCNLYSTVLALWRSTRTTFTKCTVTLFKPLQFNSMVSLITTRDCFRSLSIATQGMTSPLPTMTSPLPSSPTGLFLHLPPARVPVREAPRRLRNQQNIIPRSSSVTLIPMLNLVTRALLPSARTPCGDHGN